MKHKKSISGLVCRLFSDKDCVTYVIDGMKIVQSFWTKPTFQNKDISAVDRLRGGWNSQLDHLTSWALSCHQLRKFYDEVELVTDEVGKQILVDQMQLPYSNVRIELDQFNSLSSDLWAVGKIHAYSIQTKPFIHVDGDVFIWNRFPPEIEGGKLVCQNFDCNQVDYQKALHRISSSDFFIPDVIRDQMTGGDIYSCNAGILGGNDVSFLNRYAETSFDFINRNLSKLDGDNFPAFNILFEQYLFYCLSKEQNIPVVPYFQQVDYGFTPQRYVRFWNAPSKTKYIHVISRFKKKNSFGELIAWMLKRDHPQAYYRILKLRKSFEL